MEYSILNYVMDDGFSYEALAIQETPKELPPGDDFEGDLVQSEFDPKLSKADRQDCVIAAASGLIASAIDILWVGEFSLERAEQWGQDKVEDFVVKFAKSKGYSGGSTKGAIKFLEDKFPLPADAVKERFGAGQHHLWDFTHHPSLLGLASSILSQFCGKCFGVDKNGVFIIVDLPEGTPRGSNFAEKVFFGTVMWVMHLISDMAGSSGSLGKGTGIPGPIMSLLYEIAALPIFKKEDGLKANIQTELSRLFNGVYFREEGGKRGPQFDLRMELGIAHEIGRMAVPVVVNECIVRAFYSIKRFYIELKSSRAKSLSTIKSLKAKNILPFNSRPLTRMLTVSSGVFMATECTAAVVSAIIQSGGSKEKAAAKFLLNVNYVGIGRFVVACAVDAKYIADDIREAYEAFDARQTQRQVDSLNRAVGIKQLLLTESQASILDSLKLQMVLYDISKTKKETVAASKARWKDEWLGICDVKADSEETGYYVKKEIERELQESDSRDWLRVVSLELMQFSPYFKLGSEDDKDYKKLKFQSDYFKDCYFSIQTGISDEEFKELKKAQERYLFLLSGKHTKIAIGVAASAAVTVATMGAGWIFAPEVAVLIAGESFASLSGAALTSASLAAVGGGSLAAGGAGMAGGTAIIAGGGALLGAASSGAASLTSTLAFSSKSFTLQECTKLLAFCEVVLIGRYGDKKSVAEVRSIIDAGVMELEEIVARGKSVKKPDKELKYRLGEQKSSLTYLKRCSKQLDKMLG